MRLKGAVGRLYKPSTTFAELTQTYHRFSEDQVEKARKLTGREDIKADSFLQFIAQRTDLCPHTLITPGSAYLVETIAFCDGEMGLNLPGPVDEVSGIFFDALSIIRTARALVRKEDK